MKSILLPTLCACFVSAATPFAAMAQDQSGFRNDSEGNWYHPIEIDDWVSEGGNRAIIQNTLQTIESTLESDNIAYSNGVALNEPKAWAPAWTAAGDAVFSKAKAAEDNANKLKYAREALVYYLRASSPHTNAPEKLAALNKASEAYLLAGTTLDEKISKVSIEHNNSSFEAFLHLPVGDAPFPVLVASQGSDQSKEELFTYFTDFLAPRGIALLSLDMPGMGASRAFTLSTEAVNGLHLSAIDWAKAQKFLDSDAIFLQGSSFGGSAAAQTFVQSDDLELAGIIYACGLIEDAFQFPAEVYAQLPAFTMDGVKTRFGLPIGGGFEEVSKQLKRHALSNQRFNNDGKIDTPILAILTNQDPVSPMEEINQFLKRGNNVTRVVLDEPGHCPQSDVEDILSASFIVDIAGLRQDEDEDDD